ncbi:MAG: hypothetical protein WKF86_05275 [Acidimicrobiales bacterium]
MQSPVGPDILGQGEADGRAEPRDTGGAEREPGGVPAKGLLALCGDGASESSDPCDDRHEPPDPASP